MVHLSLPAKRRPPEPDGNHRLRLDGSHCILVMLGQPRRALETLRLPSLSVGPPGPTEQTGCFQLRPRSGIKERQLAEAWTSMLCHPYKLEARIPRDFFGKTAWVLATIAFPHTGLDLSAISAPERFLPRVPSTKPSPGHAAAERVWAHCLWALEKFGASVWPGFHQTVRMVIQACSTVFVSTTFEDQETRTSSRASLCSLPWDE